MAELSGFLAIRRATVSSSSFFLNEPFIDDIALLRIENEEELPEDFKETKIVGDPIIASCSLSFRKQPAMGICDLCFESATIDRFPKQVCVIAQKYVLVSIPVNVRDVHRCSIGPQELPIAGVGITNVRFPQRFETHL